MREAGFPCGSAHNLPHTCGLLSDETNERTDKLRRRSTFPHGNSLRPTPLPSRALRVPPSCTGRNPYAVIVRAENALTHVALRQRLSTVGRKQCSTQRGGQGGLQLIFCRQFEDGGEAVVERAHFVRRERAVAVDVERAGNRVRFETVARRQSALLQFPQ